MLFDVFVSPGHRRDVDLHRRPVPERRRRQVEVPERHRLLRLRRDRLDRLRSLDRRRARADRQVHDDAVLLEVARVLDGGREREVGRDLHRRGRRRRQRCRAGVGDDGDERDPCRPLGVPPVEAPFRWSSTHAERPRARRARCSGRTSSSGMTTPVIALGLQLLRRGQPVELLPDDVARGEQLGLRGERVDRVVDVLLRRSTARATSPSAASPFARSSIASMRCWWICRSGPGGWICCAWSYSCCSCCAYCCRL